MTDGASLMKLGRLIRRQDAFSNSPERQLGTLRLLRHTLEGMMTETKEQTRESWTVSFEVTNEGEYHTVEAIVNGSGVRGRGTSRNLLRAFGFALVDAGERFKRLSR